MASESVNSPVVVVEQSIDGPRRAVFRKEIVRADVGAGVVGPLALVRKRLLETPTSRGAVLLVHGYAQNRYSWHVSGRSLANHLAAAGYDVYNLELRGVGRSRALGAAPARSVADFVTHDLPAAVAAVARRAPGRPPFLVGHSLGALVALAYAGRASEPVRGVVSLAGIYDFARRNPTLRLVGRAMTFLPDRLAGARAPTDLVGRALHAARAAFDARAATLLPLQAWAPGSMAPDVLAEAVRRSFEPASLGVTRDLGRLSRGRPLLDADGLPLLAPFERRRDIPLLVVAGRDDALVSVTDARAAVDRSSARDRTFVSPPRHRGESGWGHMDILLGDRAPHVVWPVVTDWLARR